MLTLASSIIALRRVVSSCAESNQIPLDSASLGQMLLKCKTHLVELPNIGPKLEHWFCYKGGGFISMLLPLLWGMRRSTSRSSISTSGLPYRDSAYGVCAHKLGGGLCAHFRACTFVVAPGVSSRGSREGAF
jgi:hypothetical protein